jgi:ABC-type uncharacterized transport system permease subunit
VEQELKHPMQLGASQEAAQTALIETAAPAKRLRPQVLLCVPAAALIALAVHWLVSERTRSFSPGRSDCPLSSP